MVDPSVHWQVSEARYRGLRSGYKRIPTCIAGLGVWCFLSGRNEVRKVEHEAGGSIEPLELSVSLRYFVRS